MRAVGRFIRNLLAIIGFLTVAGAVVAGVVVAGLFGAHS